MENQTKILRKKNRSLITHLLFKHEGQRNQNDYANHLSMKYKHLITTPTAVVSLEMAASSDGCGKTTS